MIGISDMIEVKEKDFNSFFKAPFNAYGPNSLYVSPFKSDLKRFLSNKNPLFKDKNTFTFFSAFKNGTPVGRVVVHVHKKSNEKYKSKTAYFGFFDCIDDLDVAKALFDRVERWARINKFSEIMGNFNLTAMQQIGVTTDGFENVPYMDQVYSPPQISKLLEKLGYNSFFPMTTFEIDLKSIDPEILNKDMKFSSIDDEKIKFEKINKRNFKVHIEHARICLNDGFANNPMFVPVTKDEFYFQSKDMSLIIDNHISTIAYHDNRPIGVSVCLPDLNPFVKANKSRFSLMTPFHLLKLKTQRKRAGLIYTSVIQDYQVKGLGGILMYHTLSAVKSRGYEYLGVTWISDENIPSLRNVEKAGGKPLHKLCLYKKEI